MQNLFKNLTVWVFLGAITGYCFSLILSQVSPSLVSTTSALYEFILLVKNVFLSALKMMIAPMILFSLLGGIVNIGEITKLRALGKVTVTYYLSTTIIAIFIGLIAVFFIHPWENSDVKMSAGQFSEASGSYKQPKKFIEQNDSSIVGVFAKTLDKALENPIKAFAENNILAIVTQALLIGLAILVIRPKDSVFIKLIHEGNQIIHKILGWIILLTPLGVFAVAFDFQLKAQGSILSELFYFCLLVFMATMIHGLIVLPTLAWMFAKVSPIDFFKKAARPLLVAFSTASSSATLPVTMQTCEEEFGVDESVSGFVFPLGATMNMDGTALFEGIAAIFLAYLYGVELSTSATFAVFFMSMISSIGAPGMPSASMSGMQMVLLAAGIPLEAIGILLVIDRPLDTFRTAVNVEGDMIGALITQRYLDKKQNLV